jgi:exopolyphosphatase/guanosine-5'-triphosphate,3'-diphosphate pyrophosphatase
MKRAVLDIGSNTIRLLIAEVGGGQYQKIHYQHRIARLGQGLQQTGQLSEEGKQRALAVFKECVEVCASFDIDAVSIKAVATAAVREASNGKAFVAEVLQDTGLNIQIISGQKEASLALTGARLGLGEKVAADMLFFDIGGASTEFARIKDGKLVDSISQKLGVVRLKELYMLHDPITEAEYQSMKQHTQRSLEGVLAFWGNHHLPKYLVGTAGTVTALAAIAQALKVYDSSLIDGYALTRDMFVKIRDKMLSQSNVERLQYEMLEKGREDVIVAGLAIVDVLFERWGYQTMITVDAGLLEGLLLDQS